MPKTADTAEMIAADGECRAEKSDKPASGSQEETVRRLTEKVERVKAGAKSGRPAATIPPKSS